MRLVDTLRCTELCCWRVEAGLVFGAPGTAGGHLKGNGVSGEAQAWNLGLLASYS